MNKHINKNKSAKPAAQNRTLVEVDHMPVEVATSMLCGNTTKLTARQRKTFQAARENHFISTLQAKPTEENLNRKFQAATAKQLGNWYRRCTGARQLVQDAYVKAYTEHNRLSELEVKPESPEQVRTTGTLLMLDKALAALLLRAEELDLFRDNLEDELLRRKIFISTLRKVCAPVAASLTPKLLPA